MIFNGKVLRNGNAGVGRELAAKVILDLEQYIAIVTFRLCKFISRGFGQTHNQRLAFINSNRQVFLFQTGSMAAVGQHCKAGVERSAVCIKAIHQFDICLRMDVGSGCGDQRQHHQGCQEKGESAFCQVFHYSFILLWVSFPLIDIDTVIVISIRINCIKNFITRQHRICMFSLFFPRFFQDFIG